MPNEGSLNGNEIADDEMNFELLDMFVEEGNAAEYKE
jgi:hypothetical protein